MAAVMSEQNKELVRRFVKAWDAGDTDSFGDFIASDAVNHQPMPGTAPGLEEAKQAARMTQARGLIGYRPAGEQQKQVQLVQIAQPRGARASCPRGSPAIGPSS